MTQTRRLTSPSNPLLKEIRRATTRGTLTEDGFCVAETFHLLREALASRCAVGAVVAAESAAARAEAEISGRSDTRLVVVPDALFRDLAATETPQGVVTLVRPPAWAAEDVFAGKPLVVVLDGVQDPGNAGTVIRAAEAFGASGVAFLKGGVNPLSPKALRASAGSVFRVPTVCGVSAAELMAAAKERGLAVFAAKPTGGAPACEIGFTVPCAVVVGAEGSGLDAVRWADATPVTVPTRGVESLNVAVAAAVLLYEASRQRGAIR